MLHCSHQIPGTKIKKKQNVFSTPLYDDWIWITWFSAAVAVDTSFFFWLVCITIYSTWTYYIILLVLFFVCVSIKVKFCSSELRQLSLVDLPVNQTPSVKGRRMSVPLFNITHKQVVIMMYLIFAVHPFAFWPSWFLP